MKRKSHQRPGQRLTGIQFRQPLADLLRVRVHELGMTIRAYFSELVRLDLKLHWLNDWPGPIEYAYRSSLQPAVQIVTRLNPELIARGKARAKSLSITWGEYVRRLVYFDAVNGVLG